MGTAATPEPGAARTPGSAASVAPRDRNIAAACALLLLISMPVGYLTDDPGTGDVIGLIVMVAVSLALMAWLILRFVPAQRAAAAPRASRTALVLGVVAVILGVVFWTGLPFAVGAAAIALGLSLRETSDAAGGSGKATAGAALGAFAVLASFVLLLVG